MINSNIWKEYQKALLFNEQIGLNETVKTNENFFIGKQWEGVEANGLPTPVFNFLKRVVLFTIAGFTSANIKLHASSMSKNRNADQLCEIINNEFEKLFEQNKLGALIRELMRNAAVDGDGCLYTYWDQNKNNGSIITEVIENTRVFFANPNDRRVEKQPYIIISSREAIENIRKKAKENGNANPNDINPDTDNTTPSIYNTNDKVTVLLKMWKNESSNTIHACEVTKNAVIRQPWDTGLTIYPITWLCWDYIQDSYHGQAMITGLIPNQIFINKLFAMSMISLMTTAYPKVVYDKTRIAHWDNRVGAAIPIAGGDVNSVARIIDPAQISPQIAQFIDLAVGYTQTFLGATNAALGDVRPDNTSAIIALQKASAVPAELTKQNLYQSIEDLGHIYIDFMRCHYGIREIPHELTTQATIPFKQNTEIFNIYNFKNLNNINFSLKLDVGTSSYWSEITAMQTLDNMLLRGNLSLIDYLERIPDGYITKKQELLDKLKNNA